MQTLAGNCGFKIRSGQREEALTHFENMRRSNKLRILSFQHLAGINQGLLTGVLPKWNSAIENRFVPTGNAC